MSSRPDDFESGSHVGEDQVAGQLPPDTEHPTLRTELRGYIIGLAQVGVHLVFFLHLTTSPDNTNNALALAFGVLIVSLIFFGSIWVMYHLNGNMIPASALGEMRRG